MLNNHDNGTGKLIFRSYLILNYPFAAIGHVGGKTECSTN